VKDAHINTEGGAAVEGSVQSGTFIGHDQIVVISGYSGEDLDKVLGTLREILSAGQAELCADVAQERLTVTAPGAPRILLSAEAARDILPIAARRADERAYLTALLVNPRYGRWATQFVPLAGTLTTFERPPGWTDVPPEFTLLEAIGEGPARQIHRVHLDDITQATAQHDALVLLGEPGAGKTTVLYRLALDAAQRRLTTGEGSLPLYLSLADYRNYASPTEFVTATWQPFLGGGEVTDWLHRGELLLLLDALNEMPFRDERDYRERVGAWRRFVENWPGNHLLFTCRSRDYSEPLGLHQVEIQQLDDERVQNFLGKYLADDLARTAWERLDGDPLLKLVRNPYYLSILAYILAAGGKWPTNRARMLNDFVELLLAREQTRNHPDWPGAAPLRDALAGLAERIQPLGQGIRLPRGEMLARIPAQVAGPDGPVDTPPPVVLRLGLRATLLDIERSPEGEERTRFYHHQLQELFAAHALLSRFRAGEDLTDRWRWPRLVGEMEDPGSLGDFEPLPSPPTTGWEEPTVLATGLAPDPAAFVEAVRQANPVLAARCLTEAGIPDLADVTESVQGELLREMEDPQVHLRARIAAGEALGTLDDPRFQRTEVEGQQVLLPPLVHIPAGTFHIGSSRLHVLRWMLRGFTVAMDELPRHKVNLPTYYIGRFPVTNAEYAGFLEAGGYRETRYWPDPIAQAWLQGEEVESGAMKQAMQVWQAVRENPVLLRRAGLTSRQVTAWEQLAQMDEDEARQKISEAYVDRPRDRPAYWEDEQYSNPAQPVVGVNWYEAQAYCRWLTDIVQMTDCDLQVWRDGEAEMHHFQPGSLLARLPTEAEWERAARGERGRIYPWGNRWDAARCNTWEGHVLRPTPAGVYPHGLTPEGAHDMAGNVWEWTASLYRPYPYDPDDGRNDPESEDARVVRGGSWNFNEGYARCAIRNGGAPDDFDYDFGYRVVVSLALASSES